MSPVADDYVIELAEKSRLPEVLHFLHENFDKEETMLTSLRANNSISKEDEDLMRLDHERLLRSIFECSPCLVALCRQSRELVGANVMILSSQNSKSNDAASAIFSENLPRTALGKEYFRYLTEISERADLYGKFPSAKSALEFYAIAVDKRHRRRGLSKRLMDEGISFARTDNDVGFVFGVYTSLYSKKAAINAGLKSLLDVDLLTYVNAEGKPIFQDTRPHNVVSVMALEI